MASGVEGGNKYSFTRSLLKENCLVSNILFNILNGGNSSKNVTFALDMFIALSVCGTDFVRFNPGTVPLGFEV